MNILEILNLLMKRQQFIQWKMMMMMQRKILLTFVLTFVELMHICLVRMRTNLIMIMTMVKMMTIMRQSSFVD